MRSHLNLEAFEARIVPAAVVKFTEMDGDTVTVRTNKGTTEQLEEALGISTGQEDVSGFTVALNRTEELATAFAGTNVTITAKGPGNKLADTVGINDYVGFPNRLDLGNVSVKGNLSYCDAGDGDAGAPAIRKLTVTNWSGGNQSFIQGDIGAVVVKESFNSFLFSCDGALNANYQTANGTDIGSFTCKGFGGDDGNNTALVQVNNISKLTIKGTFTGDDAFTNNGLIQAVSIDRVAIGRIDGDARIEMG